MRFFYLLFGFNFSLLISFLGKAESNAATKSKSGDQVYIVYMGKVLLHDGSSRNDHAQLIDELNKRKKVDSVLHTYNKSFLGFVARISDEEAESIAHRPGVVSVFPDKISQLHTTRSWDFLMKQTPTSRTNGFTIPPVSNFSTGADTIIGFIDTGIWPEHPSFRFKCMGPTPKRWKGICMRDKNLNSSFECNTKVIGARFYDDPDNLGFITSARDNHGHGTHLASVAAGKAVRRASYKGLAKGIARGGAPDSKIAVYKISAGNDGPSPGTVSNFAPWILTVGSTTIDRKLETIIVLGRNKKIKGEGGITFSGLSKYAVYQLVDGRSAGTDRYNASNCIPGSLDDAKVRGKIVLCENNDQTFLYDKIQALMNQGAVGIIMINDFLKNFTIDYGTTPFAVVGEADGVEIRSYINSKRNPLATILPTITVLNQKPAPVVAYSSSRGPTPGIKDLLKPDVAAPGVHILAASPPLSDTSAQTTELHLFKFRSGTSISCPHVSGLAATVKSQHPTWSPSAIRSAIMTTAINTNNLHAQITTVDGSRATPYDIGAGEINLLGPFYPGLVYDTQDADYIQFLCNIGYNASTIKSISSTVPNNFNCPCNSSSDFISNMNYPSIAISGLEANGCKTVTRTVTNVGEVDSTYTATLEAPYGLRVQVVPKILRFTKIVTKLSFQVTFTLTTSSQGALFGSVILSNQIHEVRSPFVVNNDA